MQTARAMGIATDKDTDDVANQKLLTELKILNEELAVPTPEPFGIERDQFLSVCTSMAEQALASGFPANNLSKLVDTTAGNFCFFS